MRLFEDFFSENIVAFVSDRSVDFTLGRDQRALSCPQTAYLSRHVGFSVKSLPLIRQVHGDRVSVIDRPDFPAASFPQEADAVLTNVPAVPLTVRTADCLAVFLYDPRHRCIGLVHAGWRGSRLQVAAQAVKKMSEQWATRPQDLLVAFGPAIRGCCYQVGREFKGFFPEETIERQGSLYLDLPSVNRRQMLATGVLEKNFSDGGQCTCCDERFFSYRREGEKAGRHLSVMMLLEKNKGRC